MADFEDSNPLADWDFPPEAWQVVNEGGQNILIGQGSLQQPMVILGRETPEWLDSNATDFVLSYTFNLDPQSGGLRVVFRFNDGVGYNVLEVFPGLMFLKRNAPTVNVFNRDTERLLRQNTNLPISGNTWHDVTIWVEGSRIFVYLDGQLAISAEDLITPQLGAGQIFLQTNNTFRPVRLDNIVIQRAEPFSDHFQSSRLPSTWTTTNTTNTTIVAESDGNQYVRMENEAELAPVMSPVQDFTLRCQVWSENGGWQLYLRESAGGSMLFDLDAGNMVITYFDGGGGIVSTTNVNNFYTRGLWQDLSITFLGDRLEIYLDGRSRFEDTLEISPGAGTLRFVTSRADIVRLDDCMFTQAAQSSNSGASFAFALQQEVLARDFRWLRSDLDENFDSVFRTQDWWVDGTNAVGQFVTDPGAVNHQNFIRLTHLGTPTWRLFRDIVGVEIFGAGTDASNYNDSTDIYTTLDVRFPDDATGTAWMGLRVTPSLTGADLQGYIFEITRAQDGSYSFTVRYNSATRREVYFEGAIPGTDGAIESEWVQLIAISFEDQLAFFADGRFVTSIDNALVLGGTVALGVEEFTTVDFDTLIIRDTSPHG